MLNDGIDNDIVTVDFLEGYFHSLWHSSPLLVTCGNNAAPSLKPVYGRFRWLWEAGCAGMPASSLQSLWEWRAEKTVHNTVPCSNKYFRHIFLRWILWGRCLGADHLPGKSDTVGICCTGYLVALPGPLRWRHPFVPDFLPGPSMLFYQRIPAYALGSRASATECSTNSLRSW